VLDGLPPAMRGTPQIEVAFDIDANGILNVSAKDKATGKSQHIRIEASSGLSEAEIKRMKEEAQANAESDKKAKEETDKVNAADALIFQSEKQMKDNGDKLSQDKKEAILKALSDLKDAHKERDLAKIDTSMAALNTAWQNASEEMYKATQEAQAGAGGGPQAGNAGDGQQPGADKEVTDVDFEEVKDDKK
jgi:molecular chaperone DnaK